jgi:L-cysteine S-thiosulfotransferase
MSQNNSVSKTKPTTRLTMQKTVVQYLGLSAAALVIAGCATLGGPNLDALADSMMKGSFRAQGIAGIERLNQDEANRECSLIGTEQLPEAKSKAIEAANFKTIKWPSDGKFLGDWREGEKLAQNGRGLTWSDLDPKANGGNCYNCHKISEQEVSYGTIGPSLYQYGKIRGVSDPANPSAKAMLEYTWGKIWNAKAYNACSNMPRLGHIGALSEKQIQDIMALLLDPNSPVNK